MAMNISSQLSMDVQALGNLKREAKTDPRAALKTAAQQFEALMTGQLLKQMRKASLSEDSTLGENGKMYLEMFDQQVAQQISQAKGLGLADMLVRQMTPSMPGASAPAASGAGPVAVTQAKLAQVYAAH